MSIRNYIWTCTVAMALIGPVMKAQEQITIGVIQYDVCDIDKSFKDLHEQGYRCIAGIDEVGRGPLAGPVVAAAVVLPEDFSVLGIDDSKKLSEKRREELFVEIKKHAVAWGIGMADHQVIDEINILQATFRAMAQAIAQLDPSAQLALVDGNRAADFGLPVRTIVKGDGLSASIAAASILAKVTRDRLMEQYAEQYPQYGFEIHKGYGTKRHYAALREFGPCPIHRMSFLKKFYGEK